MVEPDGARRDPAPRGRKSRVMNLDRFERLNSFPRPTPLEELPRLRAAIGCRPRLFVKRDDTTTVGLGGNKVRKLDFVLADALARGADTVVTAGAVQSNHCRQTAALAARLGLACHLVLAGEEPAVPQGNLLLDAILGATAHFVAPGESLQDALQAVAADLTRRGGRPYVVPVGASVPLGALGYVESVTEALDQAAAQGVAMGHAFLATGSAGTQAGIEVGARLRGASLRVHGISVSREAAAQAAAVAQLANETLALLDAPGHFAPRDILVHDRYYEAYGKPTPGGTEAIRLLARTEGILADPVYTGKALDGMIDLLRQGACDDAEAVLFFHTGGSPALFAHAESFAR